MRRLFFPCAAILFLAIPLNARFMRPDIEKIPVERLVRNLEALAEKDSKDVTVRFNLARVHAMAFALKTETAEIWKNKIEEGAWFGHTPAFVPFKGVATKDEAKQKAARAHVEKAVQSYKAVLKIEPNHLPAQLGLAWLSEQSGNKDEAIKAYRAVIEKGWTEESKREGGPLGGNFVTVEAAGYLIPLLDKAKDQAEIKTLKDRAQHLEKLPRPITPIVIPLRDGLNASDLEDRKASVAFDADGAGLGRKWSWITKDAGWLVYDPKGAGKISSALELFGNVSFWTFWDNGYQALRVLDDDGDGVLRGRELNGLAIWADANGNGVCDPGEVRPLSNYGIVALDCSCRRDAGHSDRIWHSPRGVVFQSGATRLTFDIILQGR